MFETVPPYDLDAERAVIGAALIDEESLEMACRKLSICDFYEPRHQRAFEVILALAEKGVNVDLITFANELKSDPQFETGAIAFAASFTETVTTTANIEYHIDIILEKSAHRQMIVLGSEITKMGYDEDTASNEAFSIIEQRVSSLTDNKSSDCMRNTANVVDNALNEISRRIASGQVVTGVSSGYPSFDKLTMGFQKGGLYILAARPSMGKTALAVNFAQYAALREKAVVLFFSLEMSAEQITQRMFASEARVDLLEVFRSGSIGSEWDSLVEVGKSITNSKLFMDDSGELDTLELKARCKQVLKQFKHKKALVIIDYLQLLHSPQRVSNRVQEVTEISRTLKGIARDLNVPIIALSQLSRDVEKRDNKKPQLSDLRESGSIEQDADMVMFLYRDEYYNHESQNNTAELIVAKNRNGEIGSVSLTFLKEYSKFESNYF